MRHRRRGVLMVARQAQDRVVLGPFFESLGTSGSEFFCCYRVYFQDRYIIKFF